MAVIFAHPSFQYFAQDGEMGKNKKSTENQVIFSALRRFAIFDCDPGGVCHYIFMSVIINHLHLTIFGQFPIFTPSEFHDFLRFQNRSK